MRSAYDVLGVDPGSDDKSISAAYLRLAKALHPDHNKRPTAEKEFKELTTAWETLKDNALRKEHDYALLRVAGNGIPDDDTDRELKDFGISKPKKKKKKKKKRETDGEEEVVAQQFYENHSRHETQHQPQRSSPRPPDVVYDEGSGRGEFEAIPPGYDLPNDLGGFNF